MDIVILIFILILLTFHRFLTVFWEQGNLPYAAGFLMFNTMFTICFFINFVHWFGFLIGLIIAFLTLFQITFFIFIRPMLFLMLQWYTRFTDCFDTYSFSGSSPKMKFNKQAFLVQGLWSTSVPILLVLTIINLFVGKFKIGLDVINSIGLQNVFVFTIISFLVGQFIIFIGSLFPMKNNNILN